MAAHVSTASGQVIRLTDGSQLVFGRGPGVDLAISAGRGLSRRAGVITTTPQGAWIANVSRTHALYVAGDGYRIRLPRVEGDGEPNGGWLVHAGTAMVGSRAMLDDGLQLAVTVPGRHRRHGADTPASQAPADGDGTLLPLYLDPMTKMFLVALMWCRPWLLDPSATSPLPRTPEIARAALEVTGAHHELERFDADPEFRDRLSSRVAEHVKVLRRKITDRGLAGADVRLSDEVAVRVLIEHGVVSVGDLGLLSDPAWCSRQEDLWWSRELRGAGGRAARRRVGRRADGERDAEAHPAWSGHDRAVRAQRDRAWEEIVSLVDRVVEGALPVDHRPVPRAAHPGEADRDRGARDEPAAVEHEDRVLVAVGLAHAQLRRGGAPRGRARRRPRRGRRPA
uniref:hypothetical protein n=1 Tax=Trebonia sp. TaxID=2767075 RepID=UPI002627145C